MDTINLSLEALLLEASRRFREDGLPPELSARLERLAAEVKEPCVVAVVGKVKAGKSTFLNALLGDDLAKVGTTETTATINYFRYGTPDPERPVRCCWRGGQRTQETRQFLDSLQGNDLETLRRADGIDRLEYLLLNPFLERVTLVDTPGTSAAVDEHQDRTAEFLALQGQLRQRQDRETQQIGQKADAVIYLIGEMAGVSDQAFLEEFAQVTQGKSRALNAVGVLAKIDLQPDVLKRRHELARKISQQLRHGLNTVVPVSAGLHRAVDRLVADDRAGLRRLVDAVRRIPPARLTKLLDDEEFFLNLEPPDCPVSPDERRALLGETSWTVFTTVARTAADVSLSLGQVEAHLLEMAGFEPLRQLLERHFFQRGQFLHCFRICQDARQVLGIVRNQHLPALRAHERANRARHERFLAFVRQAPGNRAVAKELEEYLSQVGEGGREVAALEEWLTDWDRRVSTLFHELEEYNADFEALQLLSDHRDLFTPAELGELQALLGLYGLETEKRLPAGGATWEHVETRQQHWNDLLHRAPNEVRRRVADQAVIRFGLLLNELGA